MGRRIFVVILMSALLSACTAYRDTSGQKLDTLTQRYTQFDLVLAWETTVQGGKTLVDGAVKNVRYAYMNELEIWVAVLDPAGKVLARSVSYVIPSQLSMDETAGFSMTLPMAVTPGTRLRFTYMYRGSDVGSGPEAGGGGGGIVWMQSFDAVVPTHTGMEAPR